MNARQTRTPKEIISIIESENKLPKASIAILKEVEILQEEIVDSELAITILALITRRSEASIRQSVSGVRATQILRSLRIDVAGMIAEEAAA